MRGLEKFKVFIYVNFDKLLLRAIQRVKVKGIYHVFHYQRKYRKFKYVNKYGSLFGLLLVERRMFSSSIGGTRDMMTHRSSIPIPSFSRVIDSVQRRWKVFRCVELSNLYRANRPVGFSSSLHLSR